MVLRVCFKLTLIVYRVNYRLHIACKCKSITAVQPPVFLFSGPLDLILCYFSPHLLFQSVLLRLSQSACLLFSLPISYLNQGNKPMIILLCQYKIVICNKILNGSPFYKFLQKVQHFFNLTKISPRMINLTSVSKKFSIISYVHIFLYFKGINLHPNDKISQE